MQAGNYLGNKLVSGTYTTCAAIYNSYSNIYERLPTRAQHTVSIVTKGGTAYGLYYLSGAKSAAMCRTFTPGYIWAMKAAYQATKCVVSECNVSALDDSLTCGFPLYIKVGLTVTVLGFAAFAGLHLCEAVRRVPRTPERMLD